jgi:uncharacterized membrane protein YpjA
MIDWDSIPAIYTHAAMDADGSWYVYTTKPSISSGEVYNKWVLSNASEDYLRIHCTLELPWEESLIERANHPTLENFFKL